MAALARTRTVLSRRLMAAATTVIASMSKAAACRMRSFLEGTCSQAGMPRSVQSLPNTPSIPASWGSDVRRPTSMRRSWYCWW